jgi:hypothetical protein
MFSSDYSLGLVFDGRGVQHGNVIDGDALADETFASEKN